MTGTVDDTASGGRLAEQDFTRIAGLLHRLTGIYLTEAKRAMVVSRLGRRVKALGLGSLTAYVDLIHSPAGAAELEEMIQALTTNMTRFDREAAQFVQFDAEVMPDLAARARAGERVRLWSAGCSSGEEAYSLGFRVLDHCPEAGKLDLRILATDIDRRILNRAMAGRYAADLLKPLSPEHRERYFVWPDRGARGPGEALVSVCDALRALIAFRVLNLLSDWPFGGLFDVIMCRNVTIYFDAETQARLWRRFSGQLVPGGVLYIGHSEGISAEVLSDFETLGAGIFRKRDGGVGAKSARGTGRADARSGHGAATGGAMSHSARPRRPQTAVPEPAAFGTAAPGAVAPGSGVSGVAVSAALGRDGMSAGAVASEASKTGALAHGPFISGGMQMQDGRKEGSR